MTADQRESEWSISRSTALRGSISLGMTERHIWVSDHYLDAEVGDAVHRVAPWLSPEWVEDMLGILREPVVELGGRELRDVEARWDEYVKRGVETGEWE